MNIKIHGKVLMINEDEVRKLLIDRNLHPVGMTISTIQSDAVESTLKANPMVKDVLCYHTPEGDVTLDIQVREPKFLILGNEKYYVDTEKELIPVSMNQLAYVPVVTGTVTKGMAKGKLYDFVEYITANPFWNSQIEQIHVRSDMKVELVPRVGDALIFLGKLDNFEDKLNRVAKLYRKGFSEMGWNKFVLLDLQYDNQVVAKRRKLIN
jgi:cell division protein FtsQ